VPFAACSYVLARLLLRVASSLGVLLAPARPLLAPAALATWSSLPALRLRPSGLALGYGTRGPPSAPAA
jgi:hypothetical protein